MTEAEHPTALISYSHDSPDHERLVLELCNRLRAHGIDTIVDQFLAGAPSEGWPLWMERQIENRDYTLMVCTETYRRRFMEDEAVGVGRGVVWEARILRNLLYEDSERHHRIVPLLLEPDARRFVPMVFHGHFYDVSDDRGFEGLLRHLLREPGAEIAALGPLGPQGSRWSAFERPWLVPDALRTRYFTGRDDLLARVRKQLTTHHRAALSGLGGVGKTQTAIEYAVRHRADYPDGVFWTNAETPSGLTGGFVEIAKALRLAAAASSDQEQVVRATRDWLDGTDRWLLILDNVDDRRDIIPFVPERGNGDVLITSRESVFQELGIARALEAVDLDADEAVRFLLVRTGREDESSAQRAAASELAVELGNLPLALEQAAAYVTETNASFSDYLSSFRKRRVTLLEKAGKLVSRDTVAVTWAANFENVELASPAAAEVLRIGAFLAPDAIPFEVFLEGAAVLGPAIAGVLTDPDDLAMNELLRPLARYSLVRSDATSHTFGMHRLVQEIVRESMTGSLERTYVERAVSALDAAFPEVSYVTWAQCDRVVPHVVTIARWIDALDVRSEAAGRILNRTGQMFFERGRYGEAEPLHRRALAIRESALGPDHLDVAQSLNHLGNVYSFTGSHKKALGFYERAFTIRERALGPDHPEVAMGMNGLAVAYAGEGRFAEAQPLYEGGLAVAERALGPDHPNVARLLNNLANLHVDQGRYAVAEPLHLRALSIRERANGPEHPDVAVTLNNLVRIYLRQGRFDEAQTLAERALSIRERALGPEHPDIAFSLNHLATVRAHQRRLDEAQALYERALAIRERWIGPDHALTALVLLGLASVYADQGRNADAVMLVERALAIRERKFAGFLPTVDEIKGRLDAIRAAASPPRSP